MRKKGWSRPRWGGGGTAAAKGPAQGCVLYLFGRRHTVWVCVAVGAGAGVGGKEWRV